MRPGSRRTSLEVIGKSVDATETSWEVFGRQRQRGRDFQRLQNMLHSGSRRESAWEVASSKEFQLATSLVVRKFP